MSPGSHTLQLASLLCFFPTMTQPLTEPQVQSTRQELSNASKELVVHVVTDAVEMPPMLQRNSQSVHMAPL